MKYNHKFLGACLAILLFTQISFTHAANMDERIRNAENIVDKKQGSSSPIPYSVRSKAKAIAIFSITKGGLGIGGQGGEGIIVVRNGSSWSAPSAFNLGGASIGAQIGFTETNYIIVLNTEDAIRHFTSDGKATWNATATGTAGDDNVREKASTTDLESRDIVVYKDSSGVFGGATLGGTTIERKDEINERAYGTPVRLKDILNGKVTPPKSTKQLYKLLDKRNP